MMKYIDLVPKIIALESLIAAGICYGCGAWVKGTYWLAAAVLTGCVVLMK